MSVIYQGDALVGLGSTALAAAVYKMYPYPGKAARRKCKKRKKKKRMLAEPSAAGSRSQTSTCLIPDFRYNM